jgi:hypothetical protein
MQRKTEESAAEEQKWYWERGVILYMECHLTPRDRVIKLVKLPWNSWDGRETSRQWHDGFLASSGSLLWLTRPVSGFLHVNLVSFQRWSCCQEL